jgi:hypothetical protein
MQAKTRSESPFKIDQVSFGCDVGRNAFVFFTWDVGRIGHREIAWLEPRTQRSFPDRDQTSVLTLLHNSENDYERPRCCIDVVDYWEISPPRLRSARLQSIGKRRLAVERLDESLRL